MMQWGLQLERLLDNSGYQLQIDETESQDHELKGPWRDWFVRQTDPQAKHKDTVPIPQGAILLLGSKAKQLDPLARKKNCYGLLVIVISQIINQYPKRHYLPTTLFQNLLYLHKVAVVFLAAYRLLPPCTLSIENHGIFLTPYDSAAFFDISTSFFLQAKNLEQIHFQARNMSPVEKDRLIWERTGNVKDHFQEFKS
ncbi:hypothetical protein VP01_4125g2 [Puccinia sorghi]|uniref:Uncharacterized protein n=1 Tax=Puccinia sorghi TaxID=27349 RepID=A0A0L6UT42_9BASI|nr:hypothetical protein VP01_4125g2 [Puccinia sorghi]